MKFVTLTNAANGSPVVVNATLVRVIFPNTSSEPVSTLLKFDDDHNLLVRGGITEIVQRLSE